MIKPLRCILGIHKFSMSEFGGKHFRAYDCTLCLHTKIRALTGYAGWVTLYRYDRIPAQKLKRLYP